MNLKAEAVVEHQPNKTFYNLKFYVNATTDYKLMIDEQHIDSDMDIYLALDTYCKKYFNAIFIVVTKMYHPNLYMLYASFPNITIKVQNPLNCSSFPLSISYDK